MISANKHGALYRALQVAAFAAISVVVCMALNFLLTDNVHSYTRIMMEELYDSQPIDVLFIGSSHCYRAIDPFAADELLGQNTFVAGSSQQLPDGSYHMLVEAGKQNNIQTVAMECFYTAMQTQSSKDSSLSCFLLTDYMRPSLNKYSYLWQMGGVAAFADDILPARHVIATPSSLPSLWKAKLTDGYAKGNYAYVITSHEEEYRGKGFVYTYGVTPYGYHAISAVDAQQPVSDFGQTYLDKITAYCAKNNIRLILFSAPLPSAFAQNTPNYQSYVDYMTAYAQTNGIEYWDYTLYRSENGLPLSAQDFSDAHHLNGEGAEKFTTNFCHTLQHAYEGQNVAQEFYPTLAQKLQDDPDGTQNLA